MATLKPFAEGATATAIGELKIENGQDRIAIYGSLDLTRAKAVTVYCNAVDGR